MCHAFSTTRNSKNNILKKASSSGQSPDFGSFLSESSNSYNKSTGRRNYNDCNSNNNVNCNFFIVISGPTAVGKTDFVERLVKNINFKVEIINGDLGQFYKHLNIGTAKPNLKEQIVKHHLFDILDKPTNFTVLDYRKVLIECMNNLWKKNIVPIIVGGSGFYLKSIFFPPKEYQADYPSGQKTRKYINLSNLTTSELYKKLVEIDFHRAEEINPNDRYRLEHALEFWFVTGQKPSQFKPEFQPPGKCIILFLQRNKQELNQRILDRTNQMLEQGWIEEVKNLPENWQSFLLKKKIIGYPEILDYIKESKNQEINQENLIKKIAQKTKAYAKRQLTFWKSFCKLLNRMDSKRCFIKQIIEINLSLENLDLYIKQLSEKLDGLIKCK